MLLHVITCDVVALLVYAACQTAIADAHIVLRDRAQVLYNFSVMSEGQALVYGETFFKSGNAFNNATGTFIAPLRGIYVIFATVGGNIHNSNYFYVNVNGCHMAHVLMVVQGPGQGSQSVIANLNAGDSVNVRAGRYNDGAYGEYFTSIGGISAL